MGSRLKKLFFGRSSSSATASNPNLRGSSYESAIALDPPVRGSYPVAGNGPNVLEELQRLHAKREASRRQSTINTDAPAPAPIVPRYREEFVERPRSAPHNGKAEGAYPSESNNETHGRERSRLSMKSTPNFKSSKRNSIRSIVDTYPGPVPRQVSKTSTPKAREIRTYQPKKPAYLEHEAAIPDDFPPPIALHRDKSSQTARKRKSYIDLLDAYSNIKPYRDVSRDRAQSSGMRNYGEDVADRNLAVSEINSSDGSYTKSVHSFPSPRGSVVVAKEGGGTAPAPGSAPARGYGHGHVLGQRGQEQRPSDDIHLPANPTRANPTPSTHDTQSRPASVHAPRKDSTSAVADSANTRRDDGRLVASQSAHEDPVRTSVPFVSTPDDPDEETEGPGQQLFVVPTPIPPIRARGRARTVTKEHDAPPLPFCRTAVPVPSQQRLSVNADLKSRRHTMSDVSKNPVTTGGRRSRGESLTYSARPWEPQPDKLSTTRGRSDGTANKKSGMTVEGTKKQPSLEGVVDLSNTVDTDVITTNSPAVTHEKVIPTSHEIREERITREIHTYDVFHRILPVIETEILPPKHYVPTSDGKGLVEIPEHIVPGRTATGSPSRNWEIVKTSMGRGDHGAVLHEKTLPNHSSKRSRPLSQANYQYPNRNIEDGDGADGPIIGHTRGDSLTSKHPIGIPSVSSPTSKISGSKNMTEPVLSSKKEYITKEGYPRTEYLWRHPPVFETATGKTQPIYIGAGLGDLSSPVPETDPVESYHSDEEDIEGAEFGAMSMPISGEEDLLFRDSGYGQGALPGLMEQAPLAGISGEPRFVPEDFEIIKLGKVVGDVGTAEGKSRKGSEGEATRAVRRIRGKRRSSGATSVASFVKANGNQDSIAGVEKGVRGLNVGD